MSAPDSRMARPIWFSSICAPPYQTLKVMTVTCARALRRGGSSGDRERSGHDQEQPPAYLCG